MLRAKCSLARPLQMMKDHGSHRPCCPSPMSLEGELLTLKKIIIDPGDFYTKVYVLIPAGERGSSNRSYEFYGRSFFPTLVSAAGATGDKGIYYEDDNSFYSVGYDCSGLTLDQTIKELNVCGVNTFNEYLILKKVIFDYADNNDEIEIDVVIDIPLS